MSISGAPSILEGPNYIVASNSLDAISVGRNSQEFSSISMRKFTSCVQYVLGRVPLASNELIRSIMHGFTALLAIFLELNL